MRASVMCVAAVGVVCVSGAAQGQVRAEFRIVERTGQSAADSSDNVLNFAVQARITSPGNTLGLGEYAFAMVINGEGESRGVLSRDRITALNDGTYYSGIAGPGAGFASGVAQQFGYTAAINSQFNGLINQSAGVWTQTSSQDIGLVVGSAYGSSLLQAPGVDTDGDGTPDTAIGANAVIPQSIMGPYFAAGQFIDIYRFRYTVTDLSARTLNFQLRSSDTTPLPQAWTFVSANLQQGLWGVSPTTQVAVSAADFQGISIAVTPAPGAAGLLGLACVAGMGRRRRVG